jgi:hypothetical protein
MSTQPDQSNQNAAQAPLEVGADLSTTPQAVSAGSASPLELSTQNAIIEGGNFGIGTDFGAGGATPLWPLHVGVSKTARFELTDENSRVSLGAPGAFIIDAINVPGGRFIVTSDGNVGIGQPNPQHALDVNGTLANPAIQPSSSAPSSANMKTVCVDTNTGLFYYQS